MLTDLLYRIRSLFRRSKVETELDEELLFHYEKYVERGIRSGLSPQEAQRQARLAIGTTDSVKEECREARGVLHIESIAADVRHAIRLFAGNPIFTGVIICSLAIGIGANTAIFTLMDAILWRSLPIQNPRGLLLLGTRDAEGTSYGFTYSDYRLLAEDRSFFSGMAAYGTTPVSVSIDGNPEPASSEVQMVTGGYFPLLGVNAIRGRALGPEDDRRPLDHPVVMIGHGYWERRFASDPNIVGHSISLCGTPFTIIGVTPREFFGIEVGKNPDFFASVRMQPLLMPASENLLGMDHSNSFGWLRPFVRLNPGLTVRQVESQLDFLFKANRISNPKEPPSDRWKLALTPAVNGISDLRKQFSQPLTILMAMVGILLLMACINVANMLLARAVARTPEFAMRRALGAERSRLVQQLLIESSLLALCGGLFGIILAHQATQILVKFISSGRTPILLHLEPDSRMLVFTIAVSILAGIVFGLIPALQLSNADSSHNLGGATRRSSEGREVIQSGRALVVLQVALCVVMGTSALLFGQTLWKLNARNQGVARQSLLTMRIEPRGSDQRGTPGMESKLDRLYRTLLTDIRAIPGVHSASLAHFTPTSTVSYASPLQLDSGRQMSVPRLMIYPGYFDAMGIPMLAGRDLGPADLNAESPCVVIVNETFARQIFQDRNTIGRTIQQRSRRGTTQCQIVGVAKDSRYTNLRGDSPLIVFQPFLQTSTGRGQMVLHIRIEGPSTIVSPLIREAVRKVDPAMPLFAIHSLAEEMDAALVRERMIATLTGFFGVVALALACVGLYGLFTFTVNRRTQEFGIRMALGATTGTIAVMVMKEVALLLIVGLAIGIPAAFAIGNVAANRISGLLFGLNATDPLSIGIAVAVLIGTSAMAGFLPARRASRVEPMVALRNE